MLSTKNLVFSVSSSYLNGLIQFNTFNRSRYIAACLSKSSVKPTVCIRYGFLATTKAIDKNADLRNSVMEF